MNPCRYLHPKKSKLSAFRRALHHFPFPIAGNLFPISELLISQKHKSPHTARIFMSLFFH